MKELTPKQIVRELNKYIIGQSKAKKAVAIAMRNRWRRQQVSGYMRDEIMPNNIIMIGSTGVGKTEISRRLAALTSAPFVKVEASKFTEVGYVGRDVESMIRDLMDTSYNMVQREKEEEVIELAESLANERIIDILFPEKNKNDSGVSDENKERYSRTRSKLRKKLENGDFEDTMIEIEIEQETISGMQVLGPIGMDDFGMNIKDMLSSAIPKSKKPRKMPVAEAREVLIDSEAQKLIDNDEVIRIAKDRAENNGIIFIDEIDKVVNGNGGQGPDVSREGVQRDLLPIVEGSNVNTKYGVVSTDHILFIAAGAFHISTPSEMIPELQGRFPIRVIEAVKQRRVTMVNVMRAIIKNQPEWFSGNMNHLRPLKLQDIAEEISMDISTISRSTRGKFVDTPYGVFELKHYFTDAIDLGNGQILGTFVIKKELQNIINSEDKMSPYNDDTLVTLLSDKGYKLARRTVAKYRDQLGLPVARLRKEI